MKKQSKKKPVLLNPEDPLHKSLARLTPDQRYELVRSILKEQEEREKRQAEEQKDKQN